MFYKYRIDEKNPLYDIIKITEGTGVSFKDYKVTIDNYRIRKDRRGYYVRIWGKKPQQFERSVAQRHNEPPYDATDPASRRAANGD
jgi:hypothetical protein